MFKSVQIIRRRPWSFRFQRLDERDGDLALILLWVLDFGPWQIRRFNPELLIGLEQAAEEIERKPAIITPRADPQRGKE